MDYIGLFTIAIGLSMDAFAVSITIGTTEKNINFFKLLKVAFSFGFFQFFMPIIGWGICRAGEDLISQIDHWLAFFLLAYIGIKMIYGAIHDGDAQISTATSFKTLIILSIATSIDALAAGILLPLTIGAYSFKLMIISTLLIGIITFLICLAGIFIGKKFGTLFSSKAEIFGGIILIIMGIKTLIEHLFV